MANLKVYKFGGTSLASADRMQRVATLIRSSTQPVVVVVSAMAGVTDSLTAAAGRAAEGVLDRDALEALRRLHTETATTLGVDVADIIEPLFVELEELLGAAAAVGAISPRSRDRLLATGEKLSTRLLAALLATDDSGSATAIDADTFLETDDRFGAASPVFGVIDRSVEAALRPVLKAGTTPVVTGFCGRAPGGETTTLGRGGSDYSATLIAVALGASDVTIWTDVPGVFSANPTIVPDARIVTQLNYREAAELSYYGAKVLHPRTIQPLIDSGIATRIRSTFDPEAPGTLVDGKMTAGSHPVKAVSAVPAQALISVEGTGMAGVPGIAARIFRTLADEDISVTMISQSSAESSVCMAIPEERAADAEVALRRAFRLDLAHADVDDVRIQTGIALVAVVGLGMNHTRGIAGRVFAALSRANVNVVAIAQGASELNITFAVEQDDSARAIRAVHEAFGLHRIDPGTDNADHVDLLLLGYGRIGRALATLVRERHDAIRTRFGRTPRVVGIADRSGYVFDPNGLSVDALQRATDAKERGAALAELSECVRTDDAGELLRTALSYRLARPIVVDVSDGDTRTVHLEALERGADLVTANKVPLAGPVEGYRALVAAAERSGRLLRKEATVGAGLPVVDTVEHLCATGDRLARIEGCLSGTLTYVLSQLETGRPFAEVLAEADARGYIEPNPLVDLSGEDVLRKAIILSRVAGFEIDDAQIHCRGLVDRSLLGSDRATFMKLVPQLNETLAQQVTDARAAGAVLRYVATLDDRTIDVGPQPVDPNSPLGTLSGTDNLVLIRSERYDQSPLVVSGPGAGVPVTAMGVLTDILRIMAERT